MKYPVFALGFILPFCMIGCANMYAQHEKATVNCGAIEVDGREIKRYQLPVKFYIEDSVPEKIAILIDKAVINFNKQSGMELVVLVDGPGNWAEPVTWHGSDWPFLPNQIAVTQVFSIRGILTHAPVNINAANAVELTDELIQITIEHEFGHALGLDHDSKNRTDLMWHASGNYYPDYSQSKDILECLYK